MSWHEKYAASPTLNLTLESARTNGMAAPAGGEGRALAWLITMILKEACFFYGGKMFITRQTTSSSHCDGQSGTRNLKYIEIHQQKKITLIRVFFHLNYT